MQEQLSTFSDYLIKKSNESLIPASVLATIPELDSQILESDPIIYAKVNDQFTGDIVYIAEASKHEDDVDLFCFIDNPTEGSFTESYLPLSTLVSQIDTIFPYAFDSSFVPAPLSVCKGK